MKISQFNPPAKVDDFGDPNLLKSYSDHISGEFDRSIAAVDALLTKYHAGQSQLYNPLTNGRTDPDTEKEIAWNGFPRVFGSPGPGQDPNYAGAEPDPANLPTDQGLRYRPQDEYLEWFTHRDANGKIVRVDFTCEAYDYFQVLASLNKDAVIKLYQLYIDPSLTEADLFVNGSYNPWNAANLDKGAMHLTHPANALGAEIKLAADGTVRRKDPATEPPSAATLINCADFGDGRRNSDPKIGFEINQLARAGLAITLADPVGLYMVAFDDAGWQMSGGRPASGFMKIVRGQAGQAIRATYELPAPLKAQGLTVSDVTIGGTPIAFGGQIAEHITMGIKGVAATGGFKNGLIPCHDTPQVPQAPAALLDSSVPHPVRSRKGR